MFHGAVIPATEQNEDLEQGKKLSADLFYYYEGVACPDDRNAVENVCEQEGVLDISDRTGCATDCCDVMELRPESLRPCTLYVDLYQ